METCGAGQPSGVGPSRKKLRRRDFQRITRRSRRISTAYFLVFREVRSDGGGARLGVTVTRKVGKAVRRNRIKRLVREWFRARQGQIGASDLVVIAKRGLPEGLKLPDVASDLDRGLSPGSSCSSSAPTS